MNIINILWYDHWSKKGRLKELLGSRGVIDLGISDSATVREVILSHRRRRHRVNTLNEIEDEIDLLRVDCAGSSRKDRALWKYNDGKYKSKFSSTNTWQQLRVSYEVCEWSKSVWFKQHTPRYSFILWVTMHNRLATGDRMLAWNSNIDSSCILCTGHQESRVHLFFDCNYSSVVWEALVKGLMKHNYSHNWEDIVKVSTGTVLNETELFLLRYTFEVAVHSIWRERNQRRHGSKPQDQHTLIRHIDKAVRNKLTAMSQEGRKAYKDGMGIWFATR